MAELKVHIHDRRASPRHFVAVSIEPVPVNRDMSLSWLEDLRISGIHQSLITIILYTCRGY